MADELSRLAGAIALVFNRQQQEIESLKARLAEGTTVNVDAPTVEVAAPNVEVSAPSVDIDVAAVAEAIGGLSADGLIEAVKGLSIGDGIADAIRALDIKDALSNAMTEQADNLGDALAALVEGQTATNAVLAELSKAYEAQGRALTGLSGEIRKANDLSAHTARVLAAPRRIIEENGVVTGMEIDAPTLN